MGSICLSFLGYGLLEVWAFGVIFNQNNVAENVIGLLSGSDLNFGLRLLISSCSAIAITLTTLVFVLLCRKSDRIRNHGRVAVVATAVSVAGTALIIAGMPWANFIGFVVAGAGNAWLWICWGDIYTVLETESAEMVATGSVLLQALLLVIMFAAPQAVQATLLLLLVPCSTALYLVALRKTGLSVLAPDGGVGRGVLGALNSDRTTASDKGVNCGKGSIAPPVRPRVCAEVRCGYGRAYRLVLFPSVERVFHSRSSGWYRIGICYRPSRVRPSISRLSAIHA